MLRGEGDVRMEADRGWSDAAAGLGMPGRPPEARRDERCILPSGPQRTAGLLDFGVWAARTAGEEMSVVLSHPGSGNLLEQSLRKLMPHL